MELGRPLATESLEQAGGRGAAPELLHVVEHKNEAVTQALVEPVAKECGQ